LSSFTISVANGTLRRALSVGLETAAGPTRELLSYREAGRLKTHIRPTKPCKLTLARKQYVSSLEMYRLSQIIITGVDACYVTIMILADRIAQWRTPFIVENDRGVQVCRLDNAADHADEVRACPIRYVLDDDLTLLCADLAYSEGARTMSCTDLLHMPAATFWVEWSNRPWQNALQCYGFPLLSDGYQSVGRRGALIKSSLDGRRGTVRSFWSAGESDAMVLASSMEAFFDFDVQEGEAPEPPDANQCRQVIRVVDGTLADGDDALARCFRFRYEQSWSDYYGKAGLTEDARTAVCRHSLGTIAVDIPMLLAFVLLLCIRSGLPQRMSTRDRLNRARQKAGKTPLLDHIQVRAPLLPDFAEQRRTKECGLRRGPRLHHVRGHLVRRDNQLHWRVPHLRGSVRAGSVQTRTVVWTLDEGSSGREDSSLARPRASADAGRGQRSGALS
jgi:hypothetical protein